MFAQEVVYLMNEGCILCIKTGVKEYVKRKITVCHFSTLVMLYHFTEVFFGKAKRMKKNSGFLLKIKLLALLL